MEMTITRGLAELKLLSSRIADSINGTSLVATYKKSAKKVNGIDTPDEFSVKAKAAFQSTNDLIKRRKTIKSAIVDSNAKTFVTIAGKEMTVADAIERKESISFDKMVLDSMIRQYNYAIALAQKNNETVQAGLENLLLASFGKEGRGKAGEDEIANISKPYLEQNEFVVLDVLKLGDKIKELRLDIDTFLMEVDFTLSESNCINKIVIED